MKQVFASTSRPEIGTLRMLLIGAFILLIPVALITTTLRVAISEPAVYNYSVRNYGAERAAGIPESELLTANRQIHDYLVDSDTAPLAPRVTNSAGEVQSLFNARETAHMTDVRSLVQLMFRVQMLAVAMVLTLTVIMIALWPARALAAAALYGSLLTVAFLGLTGMVAATGFDAFWSQLHGIAFTNDFWELNPRTDHLIQMYPEAFWQDALTAIGGLIAIQALALGIVSGSYLLLSRPQGKAVPPPEPRLLPERDGHPRHPRLTPPNPRHYIR